MPGSQTLTAADALTQTIELAQAAEEIGIDGAYVRVHHVEARRSRRSREHTPLGMCRRPAGGDGRDASNSEASAKITV